MITTLLIEALSGPQGRKMMQSSSTFLPGSREPAPMAFDAQLVALGLGDEPGAKTSDHTSGHQAADASAVVDVMRPDDRPPGPVA